MLFTGKTPAFAGPNTVGGVVIVDDHLLLAEAIGSGLRQRGVVARVHAPGPPADLTARLRSERPELVLLDLHLDDVRDVASVVAPLTAAGIRVLILCDSCDRVRLAEAVQAGATGYCTKSAGFARLMSDITVALTDGGLLDNAERSALLAELANARAVEERVFAPFHSLTSRERRTLRALGNGLTVSEIARDWQVSEATVRSHTRAILRKLDVQSQLAAVTLAFRRGWLRPDLPAQATRHAVV